MAALSELFFANNRLYQEVGHGPSTYGTENSHATSFTIFGDTTTSKILLAGFLNAAFTDNTVAKSQCWLVT